MAIEGRAAQWRKSEDTPMQAGTTVSWLETFDFGPVRCLGTVLGRYDAATLKVRRIEDTDRDGEEVAVEAMEAKVVEGSPLLNAAKVILLTPHIANYLAVTDPKALAQLDAAIRAAEASR